MTEFEWIKVEDAVAGVVQVHGARVVDGVEVGGLEVRDEQNSDAWIFAVNPMLNLQ